ncbi:MAG: membrane dipeptidase [Gemmatimonadota bacterium]
MAVKAGYRGDRSFEYLEPGADYRAFELAPELGRVPPFVVPLSAEQEAQAQRLAASTPMISLHEHLGTFPADIQQTPDMVRTGRMPTAYEGLAHGLWDAVFDNLMDGICTIHSHSGWKWTEVVHDLGMRLCDLAHQGFVFHATRVDDIHRAKREGRVAWIASMEGAAMIENELDRIELLFGLGVRALGIAYSEGNQLGAGLKEPRDGGLTVFGRRAVERMNKVGMLIDCSHCGDLTTLDTIECSEHPIVLSHIGARALWDSNRLAPDEVLEACAAKGGVIGIECAPHTTVSPAHPKHSLESFMDHFEYIRALVGIDHVAFGPDTLYGDHVGLHDVYAANLSIKESRSGREREAKPAVPGFERVPWVEGLENPTEGSHNILRWLVRSGYGDADIAKVMGGNVLRVLGQVWP